MSHVHQPLSGQQLGLPTSRQSIGDDVVLGERQLRLATKDWIGSRAAVTSRWKLPLAGDLVMADFDASVRQLCEGSSRPPRRAVKDRFRRPLTLDPRT